MLSAFATLLAQGQTFDVASVKLTSPDAQGNTGRFQFLPGGAFRASNIPLNFLIQQVYQLRSFQIAGDPQSMAVIADGENARYEIEAKGDPSATEAQVREMVKALLADRFRLKVHHETRDLPVYALIAAKGGIKLPPPKDGGKARIRGAFSFIDKGWIQGNAVQMAILVQLLSANTDRPVIDKTGFTQPFDFRLTWTPDTGAAPDATPAAGEAGLCPASFAQDQEKLGMKPETLSCPSIYTAVQDQLGLRLDPQKAPTDVLVIDHVERPSAN